MGTILAALENPMLPNTLTTPAAATTRATDPVRVLVVDDHESARTMLAKLLRSEGFVVEVAENGAVALASVTEFVPDVVITDLSMPVMGGLELCERLAQRDPDLPVVLVTAFGDMESMTRGMRAGAQDYLTKPVELDAVIASVTDAVARRHEQDAIRTSVTHDRRRAAEQHVPLRRDQLARIADGLRAVNERLVLSVATEQAHAGVLARQHAQLETLLGNLSEGVIVADTHGQIRVLNPAARAILGLRTEVVLTSRDLYGFEARHSDGTTLEVRDRPVERALRGESLVDLELLRVRPDGDVRCVLTNAASVRDDGGNIELAIVLFRDVTSLRLLERRRNEHLSLISHDLRTPLSSIKLMAGMIRRDTGNHAPTLAEGGIDVFGCARRIEQNVVRMTAMVEEILEVSRLETGATELVRDECNLPSLIAGIVSRLDDDRAARVIVDAGEVPVVLLDRARVDRAITNLVTNALKYSPPGAEVRIVVAQNEHELCVTVVDCGAGMTNEEMAKLFARFYRAPSGKHATGVGLGLYITRLVAEAHGGRVEVASTLGTGSSFTLRLPLVHAEAA